MHLIEKMHLQSVQNCSLPWKLHQVSYQWTRISRNTDISGRLRHCTFLSQLNSHSTSAYWEYWAEVLAVRTERSKVLTATTEGQKRSVQQNPDRERTNQRTGICLRLGLPYNSKLIF